VLEGEHEGCNEFTCRTLIPHPSLQKNIKKIQLQMGSATHTQKLELKSAAVVVAVLCSNCTKVLQIRTQMVRIDPPLSPTFLLLAVNDRMMVLCVVISLNYTQRFLGLLKIDEPPPQTLPPPLPRISRMCCNILFSATNRLQSKQNKTL
jgi:hypothetical protein